MPQKSYLAKYQIDQLKPHIKNFFTAKLKATRAEIKESDEYLELMEEYLSTKSYEDLLGSFKGENTAKEYTKWIVKFVEKLYDPKGSYNLTNYIISQVNDNYTLRNDYGLSHVSFAAYYRGEKEFTLDNYKADLEQLISDGIDKSIVDAQKNYATRKIRINEWVSENVYQELDGVLATAQCGTKEEVEQLVLNSFNWVDVVTYSNDTSIEVNF